MPLQLTRTDEASRMHYYCTPLPGLANQVTRISQTSQPDQTLGRISLGKNTVARDDIMPPPPSAHGMGFLWRPASSWRKSSMQFRAGFFAGWNSSRSVAVRHAPTPVTNPAARQGAAYPVDLSEIEVFLLHV